jgi:hypothetical protein
LPESVAHEVAWAATYDMFLRQIQWCNNGRSLISYTCGWGNAPWKSQQNKVWYNAGTFDQR